MTAGMLLACSDSDCPAANPNRIILANFSSTIVLLTMPSDANSAFSFRLYASVCTSFSFRAARQYGR